MNSSEPDDDLKEVLQPTPANSPADIDALILAHAKESIESETTANLHSRSRTSRNLVRYLPIAAVLVLSIGLLPRLQQAPESQISAMAPASSTVNNLEIDLDTANEVLESAPLDMAQSESEPALNSDEIATMVKAPSAPAPSVQAPGALSPSAPAPTAQASAATASGVTASDSAVPGATAPGAPKLDAQASRSRQLSRDESRAKLGVSRMDAEEGLAEESEALQGSSSLASSMAVQVPKTEQSTTELLAQSSDSDASATLDVDARAAAAERARARAAERLRAEATASAETDVSADASMNSLAGADMFAEAETEARTEATSGKASAKEPIGTVEQLNSVASQSKRQLDLEEELSTDTQALKSTESKAPKSAAEVLQVLRTGTDSDALTAYRLWRDAWPELEAVPQLEQISPAELKWFENAARRYADPDDGLR